MSPRSVLRNLALTVACGLGLARPAAAQLPPFEVVADFGGDASRPGPIIEASDGNFYGTTLTGGVYGFGTIFRMTRDYRVAILYSFSGAFDGGDPVGSLLQASDGHLYGATSRMGAYDQGILFRITLSGEFRILHAFNNALNTRSPTGSLVQGIDGRLYGTTWRGGAFDRGTVFRATLDGDVTVLHAFPGEDDGAYPRGLIRASDGNLYGKTDGGSMSPGHGVGGVVLFRVTPAGQVTIMRRLAVESNYGSGSSKLVQGPDGQLYGNHGCDGKIFRMSLQGDFTILTSLGERCGYDNGPPRVALTVGADGLFYGVLSNAYGGPAIIVFTTTGNHSVIGRQRVFDDCDLIQSVNGHLYGSSAFVGAIFRVAPRAGEVASSSVTTTLDAAVKLTWAPVANAATYTIHRFTQAGDHAEVAGLQAVSFVDRTAVKGQRYRYVVTAVNGFGESAASRELVLTAGRAAPGDFDGDGAADAGVFRPSTGMWSILGQADALLWGGSGDIPVAADYSGDGRADIAVFRPSTGVWHIRGVGSVAWGGQGDIPVPGYFRGGTAADMAVYRPSNGTWYIRGVGEITWGAPGDVPAPGDYDGDGFTDVAVWRPSWGIFMVRHAVGTYVIYGCGSNSPSIAAPADHDGDGKTDPALFYSGAPWAWDLCSKGQAKWGAAGDTPVPADYDGDGSADLSVYRESTGDWFILLTRSQTGVQFRWGGPGDIPVLKAPY